MVRASCLTQILWAFPPEVVIYYQKVGVAWRQCCWSISSFLYSTPAISQGVWYLSTDVWTRCRFTPLIGGAALETL